MKNQNQPTSPEIKSKLEITYFPGSKDRAARWVSDNTPKGLAIPRRKDIHPNED